MRKIALLNTAIQSPNMGDYIIVNSVKRELRFVLDPSFVVEVPTHAPFMHWYQAPIKKADRQEWAPMQVANSSFDYKFLCGTNILHTDLRHRAPQWNINLMETKYMSDVILVGVGLGNSEGERVSNGYTRALYENVLSHSYAHSVRDNRTKRFLESLGFRAICTGCATMWSLSRNFCRNIPEQKADSVVFTLTDYLPDLRADKELVAQLRQLYDHLAFWVQGANDYDYLRSITSLKDIEVIPPNVAAFDAYLDTHVCDYVGTRLHAGIEAMRFGKRSFIIEVDNRLRDMLESFALNSIRRDRISDLPDLVRSTMPTNLDVPQGPITLFKEQFRP